MYKFPLALRLFYMVVLTEFVGLAMAIMKALDIWVDNRLDRLDRLLAEVDKDLTRLGL